MSMVCRTVCRHKLQPSGEPLVVTMIVGGKLSGADFLGKLEVKVKDTLPDGGRLSFAAKEGQPETPLPLDQNVLDTVRGKCWLGSFSRRHLTATASFQEPA